MKLFGKRAETTTSISVDTADTSTVAGRVVVGGQSVKNDLQLKKIKVAFKKTGKFLVAFLVFLIIAAGLGLIYKYQNAKNRTANVAKELTSVNKALIETNDSAKALEHARKALSEDPNNVDTILTVANLTANTNPAESKQLYVRALDTFKKQDNPDVDGKSAATYWAAAQLAYQADRIEEAKKYYQKVIDVADKTDAYDQDLIKQSQEALKKLQ